MKCVACANQVSLDKARREWWICTTCGSYMCPNCRLLFLETSQGACPGTIVRGVESHPPHFTRFLGPRVEPEETQPEPRSTVVILRDVRRNQSGSPCGRVIILDEDEDPGEVDDEMQGQEQ
jgi:hypothetical protein